MVQAVQKTTEIPKLQYIDQVVDVPVVHCHEVWEPVGTCFDQCSFECTDFMGWARLLRVSLEKELHSEKESYQIIWRRIGCLHSWESRAWRSKCYTCGFLITLWTYSLMTVILLLSIYTSSSTWPWGTYVNDYGVQLRIGHTILEDFNICEPERRFNSWNQNFTDGNVVKAAIFRSFFPSCPRNCFCARHRAAYEPSFWLLRLHYVPTENKHLGTLMHCCEAWEPMGKTLWSRLLREHRLSWAEPDYCEPHAWKDHKQRGINW